MVAPGQGGHRGALRRAGAVITLEMSRNGRDELLAIQFVLLEYFSVAVGREVLGELHTAAPQSIRKITSSPSTVVSRTRFMMGQSVSNIAA